MKTAHLISMHAKDIGVNAFFTRMQGLLQKTVSLPKDILRYHFKYIDQFQQDGINNFKRHGFQTGLVLTGQLKTKTIFSGSVSLTISEQCAATINQSTGYRRAVNPANILSEINTINNTH